MTPAEMATLSRELTELRPVCEQIELVNRLATEIADAQMMVDEAGYDAEMAEMARNELEELSDQLPTEQDKLQLLCDLQRRPSWHERPFRQCQAEHLANRVLVFARLALDAVILARHRNQAVAELVGGARYAVSSRRGLWVLDDVGRSVLASGAHRRRDDEYHTLPPTITMSAPGDPLTAEEVAVVV